MRMCEMKILEDLWYGNINSMEQSIKKGSLVEQALALVIKNDNTMRAMLSDIQKEQYEKMNDSQSELSDLLE